jgi:hypothetical protein
MADLLFIAMMLAFFGLAVLLVRACDWIIGVEDDVIVGADTTDATDAPDAETVAA